MTRKVNGLEKEFRKNGFIFLRSFLSKDEVSFFRAKFEDLFQKHGDECPRALMPKFIMKERDILMLSVRDRLLETLESILGKNYMIFPDFQVHKNNFCERSGGWHCDSSREGFAPYLLKRGYKFVKVGLFFQDNTVEWGGGIDYLPYGHKFPIRTFIPKLDLKLKQIIFPLKIDDFYDL